MGGPQFWHSALSFLLSMGLQAEGGDFVSPDSAGIARPEHQVADGSIELLPLRITEDGEHFSSPILINDRARVFFYCAGLPKPVTFRPPTMLALRADIKFLFFERPSRGGSVRRSSAQVLFQMSDLMFPDDLVDLRLDIPAVESGGFLVAQVDGSDGIRRYFGALVKGSNRCGTYIGNSVDSPTDLLIASDTNFDAAPSLNDDGGCRVSPVSKPNANSLFIIIGSFIMAILMRRRVF